MAQTETDTKFVKASSVEFPQGEWQRYIISPYPEIINLEPNDPKFTEICMHGKRPLLEYLIPYQYLKREYGDKIDLGNCYIVIDQEVYTFTSTCRNIQDQKHKYFFKGRSILENDGPPTPEWLLDIRDINEKPFPKFPCDPTPGRNGCLRIFMQGKKGTLTDYRSDHLGQREWYGDISIKGNCPGLAVKSALYYLNQIIEEDKLPLWQVIP